MKLSKEQYCDALIQITAALIARSQSLPHTDQLVNDAETWLNAILRRADSYQEPNRSGF
jgi:hypothetical protein